MNHGYIEFAARQRVDEMLAEARREQMLKGRPRARAQSPMLHERFVAWMVAHFRSPAPTKDGPIMP